jgi:endonuclease/exonuclease/phosphatase family metal-dependent hydrolase
MEAKILTWNLWWQFGPWRERQPAILSVLHEQDADIIFLQEAWSQEGKPSQAEWLAGELGMFVAPTDDFRMDGGVSLGNAILSRWPIVSSHVHQLPDSTGAPGHRRAMSAMIDTPQGQMWTVCTHLDHRFDASRTRMAQCKALCEIVDQLRVDPENEMPVLMAGDFNSVPDSDEIRMLTGRREPAVEGLVFTDLWEVAGEGDGYTWRRGNPYLVDAKWPNRRLDYLFVSWPRQKTIGNPSRIWLAGIEPVDGVQASDHAAVVANIYLGQDSH